MKICKIWIKDYDQFQNLELDFTDPLTGEPVDKVCFIGSNGTGKSKLLQHIYFFLENLQWQGTGGHLLNDMVIQVKNKYDFHYFIFRNIDDRFYSLYTKSYSSINLSEVFSKSFEDLRITLGLEDNYSNFSKNYVQNLSKSIHIFSPSESENNNYLKINDVPQVSLNEALNLLKQQSKYHNVSVDNVSDFWSQLIFLIKQRESDYISAQDLEVNKRKPIETFKKEFDSTSKKPLEELSKVWNKILVKANLEFDYLKAKIPIQLNENLYAYIKLLNADKLVSYNLLSSGIRNYIFRLGHIFSLYFNQEIKNGFLLVDEPENSLYPDFLFDLIEIYQKVVLDKNNENNTQMFFATHNPIVAAQFKPHERILLDWNEDGSVSARKGRAPEGDDPNDILRQDFELTDLMGKQGRAMWVKYVELKSQLSHAKTFDEKEKLISEINEIGSLYNF